jgi:hypothetical protein
LSVVPFRKRQPEGAVDGDGPHIAGLAVCTACKAEWAAVAPAGTVWLECGDCGTERATWKYHCEPTEGEKIWMCNCESFLFYCTPTGVFCYACGAEQNFP